MTGAMYSAIAGLKAHMNKLNVIGNNVANVNTVAYKSQRAVFRDAMYSMYSSGSNGTTNKAGKNPSQVGYGSQLSNIDLNMTRGTFSPGAPMDCMLEGDGFFLVGDKSTANQLDAEDPSSFKSMTLSRVGDFNFGPDGYMMDGSGNAVYGFMSVGADKDGNPIISDQLVPIRLPKMEKVGLDEEGKEAADAGDIKSYGYVARYPVAYNGEKAGRLKDYESKVGKDGNAVSETNPPKELPFAQLESISIDANSGRISGTLKDSNRWITVGFLAVGSVTNNKGLTLDGNSTYKCGDGAGDLQVGMLGGVGETVKVQTGVTGGDAGKEEIQTRTGISYVNGSLAGKIAPGDDAVKLSDKVRAVSAGGTVLRTGGLEGSNADLANEISELITTQRGYQANTRIITVTDSMLEELVNMKR